MESLHESECKGRDIAVSWPCRITRQFIKGKISDKGIHPPEVLGIDELLIEYQKREITLVEAIIYMEFCSILNLG